MPNTPPTESIPKYVRKAAELCKVSDVSKWWLAVEASENEFLEQDRLAEASEDALYEEQERLELAKKQHDWFDETLVNTLDGDESGLSKL